MASAPRGPRGGAHAAAEPRKRAACPLTGRGKRKRGASAPSGCASALEKGKPRHRRRRGRSRGTSFRVTSAVTEGQIPYDSTNRTSLKWSKSRRRGAARWLGPREGAEVRPGVRGFGSVRRATRGTCLLPAVDAAALCARGSLFTGQEFSLSFLVTIKTYIYIYMHRLSYRESRRSAHNNAEKSESNYVLSERSQTQKTRGFTILFM